MVVRRSLVLAYFSHPVTCSLVSKSFILESIYLHYSWSQCCIAAVKCLPTCMWLLCSLYFFCPLWSFNPLHDLKHLFYGHWCLTCQNKLIWLRRHGHLSYISVQLASLVFIRYSWKLNQGRLSSDSWWKVGEKYEPQILKSRRKVGIRPLKVGANDGQLTIRSLTITHIYHMGTWHELHS